MRNFIGINSHIAFKGDLYQPVCSMVRNYHPMVWDNRKDTSLPTLFPMSREEMKDGIIDWGKLYGGWKAHGFTIDACLQFDLLKPSAWKDMEKDAYAYGESYAKYFGPSHQNLVVATEIGNEPSDYDDATYRKVFENMAKGVRDGDPKLKIVTAAMTSGKSDEHAKSLSSLKGLENLYDVLNVHTYALTGIFRATPIRNIPAFPTSRRLMK